MNLEEVKKKVEKILNGAEYIDYSFDGEDEYPVTLFDADEATHKIVELIAEICPTLRALDPTSANELEILREFYETVKSQNVGVGAHFLTFSNKVKDALEVCEKKLLCLIKRAGVMEDEEIEEHTYVTCPQCYKKFLLVWNNYSFGDKKQTLIVRTCPSGGVYDVSVECPYCGLEESL